jgi:uncharacterized phage-associated protein
MDGIDPTIRDQLEQKIVDRLLTLYLYSEVSDISRMTGDVKLQKLVFLSERDMIRSQTQGFNYSFFRWDHGPMSKGVYEDHEFLKNNRLVDPNSMRVSSRGWDVLEHAEELLRENAHIVSKIRDVVSEYGSMSGAQLKSEVYDMEISPLTGTDTIKVENIPEGRDIYFPLPEELQDTKFSIDDEWLHTLDILFTEDSRRGMEEAIQRAQRNESQRLDLTDAERT